MIVPVKSLAKSLSLPRHEVYNFESDWNVFDPYQFRLLLYSCLVYSVGLSVKAHRERASRQYLRREDQHVDCRLLWPLHTRSIDRRCEVRWTKRPPFTTSYVSSH